MRLSPENCQTVIFVICLVQVTGKLEVEPYSSKETPMIMYLNTHAALEQLRQKADQEQVWYGSGFSYTAFIRVAEAEFYNPGN